MSNHDVLTLDATGTARCWWCGSDPLYVAYHDTEWGRPVTDADRLFEKICLEGFQSGLAWITVLRKRERFREVFDGFGIDAVARMGSSDVERLLGDAGIIRHRGKIEATINNAQCAARMRDEGIDLAAHVWGFALDAPHGRSDGPPDPSRLNTMAPAATALSKDLRRRGWKFVGPTTVYSFMQSMGLVNDHMPGCSVAGECESLRRATVLNAG
ncbi:MAG: DNA-3-methyladenine glycosylase I [Actinomycetota bacterium]